MTTEQIALLRLYLADPPGAKEIFTDTKLNLLLTQNDDDVYAATADGWRVKAATVSEWYMVNIDGAFLNREQVFNHCIAMAEHYEKLGGGGVVSVKMDTSYDTDEVDSEF